MKKRPLTHLTRAETWTPGRVSLLVVCLVLGALSVGAQQDDVSARGEPPLPSEEQPAAVTSEPAADDSSPFLAGLDADVDDEPGDDRPTSGWLQLFEVLTALCIVLVGICVVVWVLRKFVSRAPVLLDRRIGQVVGRLYLSPKNVVFLVQIADRILVVGAAPNAMTCLAEITDPDVVAQIVERRATFAESLGQAGRRIAAQAVRRAPESVEEHIEDIEHQLERLKALGENEAEDTS